jgi:hypothetical protein
MPNSEALDISYSYGAANTIRGLEELLKNPECDVIVTADSDLVFHPKWYKNLIRAIPKSDGMAHTATLFLNQ